MRAGTESSFRFFSRPPPVPHHRQRGGGKDSSASSWVLFPSGMGLLQLPFTASPEVCINISRRVQIRKEKKKDLM